MKRTRLRRRRSNRRRLANWRLTAKLGIKGAKKAPKRLKTPSLGKLKKELDHVTAILVKNRDKSTCQRCLKKVWGSNCHWSHVIPKSAGMKLRWDLNNSKVLCYYCHLRWWHKNPLEATEWFKTTFPDRWAYLMENKGMAQYKASDLMAMLEEAKKKLE